MPKLRKFMVGRQSGFVSGREWWWGKWWRGLNGYVDDLDSNLKTVEGYWRIMNWGMRLDQLFYLERSLQLQDEEWIRDSKPGPGSQVTSIAKTSRSLTLIRVVAVG